MGQIPILSGVYATETAEFNDALPRNLEPLIQESGISQGFLNLYPGTETFGTGPGVDRGGIEWNGICYRVMGSKLVRVSDTGAVTTLGEVGDDGRPVSLDYSFDYLQIGSNGNLFYWDQINGVRQVTDPDLGTVVDSLFVDGYNMTTDGTFIVVTELSDPLLVDPLKYGSSESDPDPITGLGLLRNEVYAFNRYSIDILNNVGGNGFPFQVVPGAVIPRGCVSRSAKCRVGEAYIFVGSARNEALGVYQAGPGQSSKLSTRLVDSWLAEVEDPTQIVLESLTYGDQMRVLVHLPDKTLVFMPESSKGAQERVWYVREAEEGRAYRPRFFVQCYGGQICGDVQTASVGRVDRAVTTDFGEQKPWRFQTQFLYNESRGAIIHTLELVGLPGRLAFGEQSSLFYSYSLDGETWSEERAISTGEFGQRGLRVQMRPHWRMYNYLSMRFRAFNTAHTGWARLEAQIEPLGV